MTRLVRAWERSGEPRRAFAARHGLTVSQFDYWKRQARRQARVPEAVAFAPVHVMEPARPSGGLELHLAGGDRVTIYEGASIDLVRTVVTALRASC